MPNNRWDFIFTQFHVDEVNDDNFFYFLCGRISQNVFCSHSIPVIVPVIIYMSSASMRIELIIQFKMEKVRKKYNEINMRRSIFLSNLTVDGKKVKISSQLVGFCEFKF